MGLHHNAACLPASITETALPFLGITPAETKSSCLHCKNGYKKNYILVVIVCIAAIEKEKGAAFPTSEGRHNGRSTKRGLGPFKMEIFLKNGLAAYRRPVGPMWHTRDESTATPLINTLKQKGKK